MLTECLEKFLILNSNWRELFLRQNSACENGHFLLGTLRYVLTVNSQQPRPEWRSKGLIDA